MEELRCYGCGAIIQSEDEKKIGFVPKNALDRNQVLCKRCFRLKNYHQLQATNLSDDDFLEILNKIGEKDLVTRENDFEMATGNANGVIGYDARIKIKGSDKVDRAKAAIPTTLLNAPITAYCSRPDKIMFILQKSDRENTYSRLFYEIKKGLFQTEKERIKEQLKIDL